MIMTNLNDQLYGMSEFVVFYQRFCKILSWTDDIFYLGAFVNINKKIFDEHRKV